MPHAILRAGFRPAPDPNLLVDAAVYVGEDLQIAMRFDYPAHLEAIAEAAEVPRGRLAVCPVYLDRRLDPWAWRIAGPALQASAR